MDVEGDIVCVICGKKTDNDDLNQVGRFWNPQKENEHPLEPLIKLTKACGLGEVLSKLEDNKKNNIKTYTHKNCRTKLRNQSRPTKRKSSGDPAPRSSKRLRGVVFDFKKSCFYCEKPCQYDERHPDRFKRYWEVRTVETDIHKETLDLCKLRNDEYAMNIQRRLLSVKDLVAPEARYHVSCRSSFETSSGQKSGRPASSSKVELFEEACDKFLENDIELYTVVEFHDLMSSLGDEVYSVKTTQTKLGERYKGCIQFVSREGKSNIILLERSAKVLSEQWYLERKAKIKDESARIVKTAAVLLKDAIKNHESDATTYPTSEDIRSPVNQTPDLLELFLSGLFASHIKISTISQAIFAATRPRLIMPLQFGLAVATDNEIGSKWLNILLSKLGFAVSYDEVMIF